MPLDTASYPLAKLRLDGRRWNELRRLHGQISTQPGSADGSAYLEMGNTKVLCVVTGPVEQRNQGQGRREGSERDVAAVVVEVNVAGFAGVERKKRGRGDRRINELQSIISSSMSASLFLKLYPHSTITITLHVLALDGALTAACINAATLAVIDAGIPMQDYVCACTGGLSAALPVQLRRGDDDQRQDPLMDLNAVEEQELPFLTVATLGAETDRVVALTMDCRLPLDKIETILTTAIDGSRKIRGLLDSIVREHGARVIAEGL